MITATFGIYMFIIPWFGETRAMNALWLAITLVGGVPVYFACVNKVYRIQALMNLSGELSHSVTVSEVTSSCTSRISLQIR